MKIVLAHNSYRFPGGEDVAFNLDRQLLEHAGHQVLTYCRSNCEIPDYSPLKRLALAGRTVWARDARREIASLLHKHKPDLAHFHNTFPLISPSAYYACREAGVPVIQTLHNPRLVCPAATLYRDHRVCQDCLLRKVAWPGVLHGCYHGSHTHTSIVAAMLATHWKLKTWESLVDCYIVCTDFYRRKFVEAGLPGDRMKLRPHFVEDHGVRHGVGGYALFVGRLAPEKGADILVVAWKKLGHVPLKVRGDGPLKHKVQQLAGESSTSVQILPRLTRDELVGLMKGARFLVWPSGGLYETFGYVAAEAFSCGVPVIASRVGVAEEIVVDGRTGLHFTAGDADDLAAKVEWAWSHPDEIVAMGRAARAEYEAKYTPEQNYAMLEEIYQGLIASAASSLR